MTEEATEKIKWRSRADLDSQRFTLSRDAKNILVPAYDLINATHEDLIALADREDEQVSGDWNDDPFLKELYFIRKSPARIGKELYNGAKRLYGFLTSFAPDSQIHALNLVYGTRPLPNTDSIEGLRSSINGMLQFPRRYIKGLEMACAYASKELPKHGLPFTIKEFERTLEDYMARQAGHTGSTGLNEAVLRRKTLPGSYGASDKRAKR